MMKTRLLNSAIVYAILAMVGGVFYREYTKFSGFSGDTALSVVHTHYFMLGMFTFLALLLLENAFAFLSGGHGGTWLLLYHIGLNVTVGGLVARGLTQVWGTALSAGADAALSGVSGLGHILLGVGLLGLLFALRKKLGKV